jgi:uncharacterized membrane protein
MPEPPLYDGAAEATDPDMNRIVARNIRALLEVRQKEELRKGLQERTADTITRFTGSMTFVYIHAALFVGWIIWNLRWTPFPKFDPEFITLAMIASVEAIFLSTFVLISQNRMQALADKRADLDLHISLLAEHEITQLVRFVDEIRQHMGLVKAPDPHTEELKRDVAPEAVLEEMESVQQECEEVGLEECAEEERSPAPTA